MKAQHHFIFWIGVLAALTLLAWFESGYLVKSFYFVCLLLPVILATAYFFNSFLVPKYLFTRKYFQFIVYLIYTIIVSAYFEMLVITLSFIILAQYEYSGLNPMATDVLKLSLIMYLLVLIQTVILLLSRHFQNQNELATIQETSRTKKRYFTVNVDRRKRQITIDKITYVESMGDYLKIKLEGDEEITTKGKISHLARDLPDHFVRIHRSFIINKAKVHGFSKTLVQVPGDELPISRKYRASAFQMLSATTDSVSKEFQPPQRARQVE